MKRNQTNQLATGWPHSLASPNPPASRATSLPDRKAVESLGPAVYWISSDPFFLGTCLSSEVFVFVFSLETYSILLYMMIR